MSSFVDDDDEDSSTDDMSSDGEDDQDYKYPEPVLQVYRQERPGLVETQYARAESKHASRTATLLSASHDKELGRKLVGMGLQAVNSVLSEYALRNAFGLFAPEEPLPRYDRTRQVSVADFLEALFSLPEAEHQMALRQARQKWFFGVTYLQQHWLHGPVNVPSWNIGLMYPIDERIIIPSSGRANLGVTRIVAPIGELANYRLEVHIEPSKWSLGHHRTTKSITLNVPVISHIVYNNNGARVQGLPDASLVVEDDVYGYNALVDIPRTPTNAWLFEQGAKQRFAEVSLIRSEHRMIPRFYDTIARMGAMDTDVEIMLYMTLVRFPKDAINVLRAIHNAQISSRRSMPGGASS